MVLVFVYVATVIYAGNAFVMLQRKLRGDWKQSLYRFLPDEDYEKMVAQPTRRAETIFRCSAGWGLAAVLALTLAILL